MLCCQSYPSFCLSVFSVRGLETVFPLEREGIKYLITCMFITFPNLFLSDSLGKYFCLPFFVSQKNKINKKNGVCDIVYELSY